MKLDSSQFPYLITGDITIPDSCSLTIEPGVVVEFNGPYMLTVEGQLLAEGTSTDSIYFTLNNSLSSLLNYDYNTNPNPCPNGSSECGWKGIRFLGSASSDSSKLKYCVVEHSINNGSNSYQIQVHPLKLMDIHH